MVLYMVRGDNVIMRTTRWCQLTEKEKEEIHYIFKSMLLGDFVLFDYNPRELLGDNK